ncbi:MAG: alpha/beta fold hydrolase [Lentisphaeria bacterium]|nr:alpha/beta fold hydrolase [Lentisphaeria bacterium]
MIENKSLYPFTSNFIKIGDLNYHYLDEGEGPVLIMLHGNPTWSFYYRNLIKAYSGSYRCIVPDHIGCGYSDKPQDYQYRLENHVNNLGALVEHLKLDSYSLIMHDWGGPIGLGHAGLHADQIKKMTFFNSTCNLCMDYPIRIKLCTTPIIGPFMIRRMNFFAGGATKMAVKKKMSADVAQGFKAPYDTYENRIANLQFVLDIPLSKKHPTWDYGQGLVERLKNLADKPIQILWGKKDFCFDDIFLDGFRSQFPNADIHEFPNAGHYVLEDEIDAIIPIVREFHDA